VHLHGRSVGPHPYSILPAAARSFLVCSRGVAHINVLISALSITPALARPAPIHRFSRPMWGLRAIGSVSRLAPQGTLG